MNKHTPGPWKIWTGCSYRRIGSETTGTEVAYPCVQAGDGHPDITFPNGGPTGPDARLIEAAPDLLEALIALLKWSQSEYQSNPIIDAKAAAAIKKATES